MISDRLFFLLIITHPNILLLLYFLYSSRNDTVIYILKQIQSTVISGISFIHDNPVEYRITYKQASARNLLSEVLIQRTADKIYGRMGILKIITVGLFRGSYKQFFDIICILLEYEITLKLLCGILFPYSFCLRVAQNIRNGNIFNYPSQYLAWGRK